MKISPFFRGESMTEEELADYLVTLLGFNSEGELEGGEVNAAAQLIDTHLPPDVSANMFTQQILGFGMYDDIMASE